MTRPESHGREEMTEDDGIQQGSDGNRDQRPSSFVDSESGTADPGAIPLAFEGLDFRHSIFQTDLPSFHRDQDLQGLPIFFEELFLQVREDRVHRVFEGVQEFAVRDRARRFIGSGGVSFWHRNMSFWRLSWLVIRPSNKAAHATAISSQVGFGPLRAAAWP